MMNHFASWLIQMINLCWGNGHFNNAGELTRETKQNRKKSAKCYSSTDKCSDSVWKNRSAWRSVRAQQMITH